MNQNQEAKTAGGGPVMQVTFPRKRRSFTAAAKHRIVKPGLGDERNMARLCRRW